MITRLKTYFFIVRIRSSNIIRAQLQKVPHWALDTQWLPCSRTDALQCLFRITVLEMANKETEQYRGCVVRNFYASSRRSKYIIRFYRKYQPVYTYILTLIFLLWMINFLNGIYSRFLQSLAKLTLSMQIWHYTWVYSLNLFKTCVHTVTKARWWQSQKYYKYNSEFVCYVFTPLSVVWKRT